MAVETKRFSLPARRQSSAWVLAADGATSVTLVMDVDYQNRPVQVIVAQTAPLDTATDYLVMTWEKLPSIFLSDLDVATKVYVRAHNYEDQSAIGVVRQ